MSREVYSPGQCGCAHEHFDESVGEEPLHEVPVHPQHAGMVDAESVGEEILQLFVP